MTTTAANVHEEQVTVGETILHLRKGGTGRPMIVLHGIEGPEGWLAFHDVLAADASVYAPSHPGFSGTERPAWMESIAHQAIFYNWLLQEAGLSDVDLVGCGIGGWIAAEMAVMSPNELRHLVLVGAAGLRPRQGELTDIFVIPWQQVIERSYADPQASAEFQRVYGANPILSFGGHREAGRSMTMRMCYRPYMHSPSLLPTLARIRVPTLIVWGADDQIVPLDCGEQYRDAIPGSTLRVLERCGHMAHYEQPQELAALIKGFVAH